MYKIEVTFRVGSAEEKRVFWGKDRLAAQKRWIEFENAHADWYVVSARVV